MSLLYTLTVIVHVLVSIGLIISVLLQSGKGSSLSSAFGGGGGGGVMGGREAADFLSKLTTGLAVAFMVLSLALVVIVQSVDRPHSAIQSGAGVDIAPIPLTEAMDSFNQQPAEESGSSNAGETAEQNAKPVVPGE